MKQLPSWFHKIWKKKEHLLRTLVQISVFIGAIFLPVGIFHMICPMGGIATLTRFFFSRFIYSKNKQCKLYNTRCGSCGNYYSRSCVLWLALSTWFCPRLDSLTFNKTKDKKSENSKASRLSSVPRAFYCSFFCCFCNDKKPFADVYAHRPLLCAYSFLDRGSFPSFHIDISSHATIFSFY